MRKENKRKIVIPFTLDQFKDTIERIKAEYNAGNLDLVGLFEIETLEYYCEKAKENEQAQKQEKLLELYKELIKVKDEFISIAYFYNQYYDTTRGKEEILEKQIEELEKRRSIEEIKQWVRVNQKEK